MAHNIGNLGQVGGQQPLQGPQPQGPLAQHGLQPGQPGQHRHAVNFGHQPPVWQRALPPNNPLQGLQQAQVPFNPPPLPQPPTQIGGYNLPNAPTLQNVQRLPQPTFQPSPAVGGALANLAELGKLVFDADNIVQATHTKGSERFEPVEALLKQAKASAFDQAPFRQLEQAASDYVAERGTETVGAPFNRHQVQVARPQARDTSDITRELADPANSSTARKLMVADFVVRQAGTLQASNAVVMQVFARAQQGMDAGVARDLVAIAAGHPTQATKRTAADELLRGLAGLNGIQLGQLVHQAGLGTVDAILSSLSNQLPPSAQRDQVVGAIATAVASNGPLADAYVQNGQSAEVIDKVINGRGPQGGHLTPLATVRDMVARQFAFELPTQNHQTLFRGNTPASRMLTAGLERAGQGHLAGIAGQIEAIIRQEVAQAGAGATVASQGTTVGDPTVADRILQRVMPLLDPGQTPQELGNFTRFVRGSIDQAPNLGGGGADFVRNAVMLRAVNGAVIHAINSDPNATAAERTMVATVTGAIQRALGTAGPFPANHKEAGMNNRVQTMAQPNSQLNQWLGSMA